MNKLPTSKISLWLGVFFCSAGLLYTPLAQANLREDVFGAGARVKAMAGAGTAIAMDWSAIYYNPANMAFSPQSSMSIAFEHQNYNLTIQDDDEFPTPDELRPRNSLTLGMTMKIPFNISFGAMIQFGLERAQYFDQSTMDSKPRYHFYGQNLEQLSIMFGFAFEPIKGLSVGIALAPLVNSELLLNTDVPIYSGERELSGRFAWNLIPNATWYAGIHYSPVEEFHLALSYRTRMYHKLDANADIIVALFGADFAFEELLLQSYSWYSPQQIALGASFEPIDDLLIGFDITWYQWSASLGPYVSAAFQEQLEEAESDAGAGEVDDVESPSIADTVNLPPVPNVGFRDIFVPRVGIEWLLLNKSIALRTGYRFQATPIPQPDGRTNLLDANTHFFSLGTGYTWFPPWQDKGPSEAYSTQDPLSISADVYGTVGLVTEREIDKGGTQEVLNDYTFGGVVYDVGLMITARF